MRILVTGGAGFVGSHFVRRVLLGRDQHFSSAEVVVVDKLTYAGNTANLAPVEDHSGLRFVQGDVCDADLMEKALEDVSVVFHFAAETHVDRSISSSTDFVRTNVIGTHTLLESALRTNVEKIVLVSTDEVYGSIDSGSSGEEVLLRPNSPYSASKGAGDLMARSYWKTYGLPVTTIRCANNYGPYQYPEKLIPRFVTNLLDGERVPLYGDGLNRREWLHVDDHCRALSLASLHGKPGEIYNISGTVELTNLEVTSLILDKLGKGWSDVDFVDDRQGHDQRYSLDGRKAERELGYRPEKPFDQGIDQTITWYCENRPWWEQLRKAAENPPRSSTTPAKHPSPVSG